MRCVSVHNRLHRRVDFAEPFSGASSNGQDAELNLFFESLFL